MKKKLLLPLLVSTFVYGQNLETILEKAHQNNMILKSKDYSIQSRKKDIDSINSSYYPTFDMGANYTTLNNKTKGSAGDVSQVYGKVSFDIYDANEKHYKVKSSEALYNASLNDKDAFIRSLEFNIVKDFFHIKNKQVQLDALIEKNTQLKAELERIKKFYEVGSATKDDIDKLNAEYSNNIYTIDAIKHEILSLKKLFILKVGIDIKNFEDSQILKPQDLTQEKSDHVKLLQEQSNSLLAQAKGLDSNYLPKVTLENQYSVYGYDRDEVGFEKGIDKQNKLMVSVNMKLFDNGVYKKQKESLMLQKKAIEEQIRQEELSQKINIELATSQIKTIQAQIKSAKDSLIAANNTFETIKKKFEIGSVDNIAFLDALTVKTSTKAQYETAKNNLQIAYANYYYYLNKNIKEYVQ